MFTMFAILVVMVAITTVILTKQHRQKMTALENLTQAITDLTTEVDEAVRVLSQPHPTEEQVQLAADAVNSQKDRLKAATSTTSAVGGPS